MWDKLGTFFETTLRRPYCHHIPPQTSHPKTHHDLPPPVPSRPPLTIPSSRLASHSSPLPQHPLGPGPPPSSKSSRRPLTAASHSLRSTPSARAAPTFGRRWPSAAPPKQQQPMARRHRLLVGRTEAAARRRAVGRPPMTAGRRPGEGTQLPVARCRDELRCCLHGMRSGDKEKYCGFFSWVCRRGWVSLLRGSSGWIASYKRRLCARFGHSPCKGHR